MRLIDADALLKGKNDHEMISTHRIWNAPTVDAVKHGHWFQMMGHAYCSVCGYKGSPIITNYCPNCGAKMDEVEE